MELSFLPCSYYISNLNLTGKNNYRLVVTHYFYVMISRLKSLGPGLLYAGAAIGVSHLVQSTKAGAEYGYALLGVIVLAHLFKYPFFALGPRYANAAGESLVAGFGKLGKWAVWLVLALTLSTMFTVQSAVTIVTAGLVQNMGVPLGTSSLSFTLLMCCFLILQVGNFSIFDHLMKGIMLMLAISTLLAVVFSFGVQTEISTSSQRVFRVSNGDDLEFLLAFVGWMPAPLDIAIWHSIWSLSKGNTKTSNEFDFKVGFYGTALLGICFLILGANTMYGSGILLSPSAKGFAAQLLEVFTNSLGGWAYWVVTVAAFTTMLSTTLTCFDAMPRVMCHIGKELSFHQNLQSLLLWRALLFLGTVIILFYFTHSMKQMVNFATIVSFLTAPVLAWLSYRLVIARTDLLLWSKGEKYLSLIGIVILSVLSVLFAKSYLYH